jgi:hypothetical protein
MKAENWKPSYAKFGYNIGGMSSRKFTSKDSEFVININVW